MNCQPGAIEFKRMKSPIIIDDIKIQLCYESQIFKPFRRAIDNKFVPAGWSRTYHYVITEAGKLHYFNIGVEADFVLLAEKASQGAVSVQDLHLESSPAHP